VSLTPQVLLSINLPSCRTLRNDASPARNEIKDRLLRELENNDFAACWIVHDQRLENTAEIAQLSDASQEVSVYLNVTTSPNQRAALSTQLTNLTERSRKLGVRVTTLSTNQKIDEGNLNLLVRNRMSMVNQYCGIQKTLRSIKSLEPSSLRFGIWEVPAPLQWTKQISNPVGELILKSAMRFQSKRPFQHIQIDIQSILNNKTSVNKIARLLRSLNRMREQGKIEVTPIRSAAIVLRQLQFKQSNHIPAA